MYQYELNPSAPPAIPNSDGKYPSLEDQAVINKKKRDERDKQRRERNGEVTRGYRLPSKPATH